MVSVPFFKCRVTKTDVGLLRLRGGDLCLVNNVPLFTISFKWTRVLVSAITVVDFFGWIYRFANLSFIVAGDYRFNVTHTAVAQLKSVPVKDFVKRAGFWEVLIN